MTVIKLLIAIPVGIYVLAKVKAMLEAMEDEMEEFFE